MLKEKTLQLLQAGNIIAVILTIIVNSLANILPIGGKTTQYLSDALPNLFVPAGITFAIWGVIYILIIMFAVYLAKDMFRKKKETTPFLEKISFYFILSCIANIVWIFLWHYQYVELSLLAMILLFVSLLMIYLKLDIGNSDVSTKDFIFIHVPISVYLGWITVATIANVTAVLVNLGWDRFGINEQLWAMLVIIVATIITILMIVRRRDCAYSAVVIWALIGIYLKRTTDDPNYGVQMQIAYTALIAIIAIIIVIALMRIKNYIKK